MASTVIISFILVVIAAAIVIRQIKNKREGKSSCSCGCSGCAMSGICHSEKK